MMNWKLKDYSDLSRDELFDILKLRCEVFVAEQKCTDLDIDYKDKLSKHLFIRENEEAVVCLRIIPAGISYEEPSIGRFAVRKQYRKNGIGRQGILKAVKYIFEEWKAPAIRISGQSYLTRFYQSFGFTIVKGPYLEDKIPHYEMLLDKKAFKISEK